MLSEGYVRPHRVLRDDAAPLSLLPLPSRLPHRPAHDHGHVRLRNAAGERRQSESVHHDRPLHGRLHPGPDGQHPADVRDDLSVR